MVVLADHFFESYDLLPPGPYKEMLYHQSSNPTCEDLTAVWKLVEEQGSFADLFRLNAKRHDPEEYREIKQREKEAYKSLKEIKAQEARNAKLRKGQERHDGRYVTTYYRQPEPDPKHNRLIERVKADQALDLITKKKAKLVPQPGTLVAFTQWVPYKSRAEREAEQRAMEIAKYGFDPYAAPNKNVPKAGTMKRLHNTF